MMSLHLQDRLRAAVQVGKAGKKNVSSLFAHLFPTPLTPKLIMLKSILRVLTVISAPKVKDKNLHEFRP